MKTIIWIEKINKKNGSSTTMTVEDAMVEIASCFKLTKTKQLAYLISMCEGCLVQNLEVVYKVKQ